ncbi:predicted protein [Postia placenta Mad-698-R]|nr:predicted protein [Postia placenta Mad-698-R]
MSQSMDEAQFIKNYQYSVIENYIGLMATTLFVYDSIISFNLEWRAVWSRKITGATSIYLALRYATLLNVIMDVIVYSIPSCKVLPAGHILPRQYVGSQADMTYTTQFCTLGFSISTSKYNIGSLTAVLFRDGTVHFALVVGLNAANIVVTLLLGYAINFSEPVELISTVVLCRFFLNLRHFSSPDIIDSNMSSHASSFSSFASRIIGNLGEMLEDDPQAPDEDDFEGELDGLNHAGGVDGVVDPNDSAQAPSDADKAQTLTATTAMLEPETDERHAANRGLPEAPNERFNQRAIDICAHLCTPPLLLWTNSVSRDMLSIMPLLVEFATVLIATRRSIRRTLIAKSRRYCGQLSPETTRTTSFSSESNQRQVADETDVLAAETTLANAGSSIGKLGSCNLALYREMELDPPHARVYSSSQTGLMPPPLTPVRCDPPFDEASSPVFLSQGSRLDQPLVILEHLINTVQTRIAPSAPNNSYPILAQRLCIVGKENRGIVWHSTHADNDVVTVVDIGTIVDIVAPAKGRFLGEIMATDNLRGDVQMNNPTKYTPATTVDQSVAIFNLTSSGIGTQPSTESARA